MKAKGIQFTGLIFALVLLIDTIGCGALPIAEKIIPMKSTPISFPLIALASNSLPLSGEWYFSIDQEKLGEALEWFAPDYDDSSWKIVSVPHTWNVMPENLDYQGLAWYRKTFTIPSGSENAHLRLNFEAIFYLAKVWLNGQYLGQHEGGYTPFEFEVSGIIKPGEINVLAVQVDNLRKSNRIPAVLNPPWSFDWFNYGGITRDVSLVMTSRAYIALQKIISTPHLIGEDEADSAEISATITVKNVSSEIFIGKISVQLIDDVSHSTVLDMPITSQVTIPANGSMSIEMTTRLASPKLWHFDHPNLYRWQASLITEDNQVLHMDEVTIGIRSVELKDGYFFLNGEPVRLVGVTRHADYPGQGSAETVTAMLTDYDDLKTLNEVFTRPVHYPQDETILDYADRHGILFIPEVPAWQLTQEQMNNEQMRELEKQQISEMILTDFNHPCVWAWSVGNEIESETIAGAEFVEEMVAYVKSIDPTRPVGFASNRLYSNPRVDATALSDFVMMNQYFGTWGGSKLGLDSALDRIHHTWPEKTIIISEFGFELHWNGIWGPPTSTLDPKEYYFIQDGTPSNSEAADIIRQQVITEQMGIYRSKPFVAGAIFWTYQDYRTPSNFIMGLVDFDRNRRGSWEVLRDEYSPVLIDALTLSPVKDGQRTISVELHARGPIDVDMPVYTLRGYTLHWAVTSPDGSTQFSEGDIALPTLLPASKWAGKLQFPIPSVGYIVTVSIVRPTGFNVIERSVDSHGVPIHE